MSAAWAVGVASAAALAVQLATARLLSPFVGSSLETWSALIAASVGGVGLGSAWGGRLAGRRDLDPRALRRWLVLGAAACLAPWLVALGAEAAGGLLWLPLGVRVAVLTGAAALPPALALSVPGPLAVRLAVGEVVRAGRAAGRVFAAAALGGLAGALLAEFVLLAYLPVDWAVGAASLAVGTMALMVRPRLAPVVSTDDSSQTPVMSVAAGGAVVACASFASMALEVVAGRLMAQRVGVSPAAWAAVIGVFLLGFALGHRAGGRRADREPTRATLGRALLASAAAVLGVLVALVVVSRLDPFDGWPLAARSLLTAGVMFFLPAYCLGMVTPAAVRLCAGTAAGAGGAAGRLYAVSCAGSVAGALVAGWVLVPALGTLQLVCVLALALTGLAAWAGGGARLVTSLTAGGAVAGLLGVGDLDPALVRETGYYAVRVRERQADGRHVLALELDRLVHSLVDPGDPGYLGYEHQRVQAGLARLAGERADSPARALVVGGGGYSLPRWIDQEMPGASIDVVEIDPGVTQTAQERLGLRLGAGRVTAFHADGRQFLAAVPARRYDFIVQDVVNDFSVPAHLLTREHFRRSAEALADRGVFCATVIDVAEPALYLRAVVATLRAEFTHVRVLAARLWWQQGGRGKFVVAAGREPLDVERLRQLVPARQEVCVSDEYEERLRHDPEPLVLTDRFAPVDRLLAPLAEQVRGAGD